MSISQHCTTTFEETLCFAKMARNSETDLEKQPR